MIRIALVSYLNTRPFIDGLEASFLPGELQLDILPPVQCAEALRQGVCDMALLPVGSLLDFKGVSVMKDFCIGAEGNVESVVLLGETPVEEMEEVVMDPHSRTSNALCRMLLEGYWEKQIPYVEVKQKHFNQIKGTRGGVVIGDKAFRLRKKYPYVYDLSGVWRQWTGLPFVFAIWAYQSDRISPQMLTRISKALHTGIEQIEASANRWAATFKYTESEASHYLNNCIQYKMDAPKHKAMQKYVGLLPNKIPVILREV